MKKFIDCALKRTPCDLVLRGVRVLNVFTGELQTGDLGVTDGKIVGVSSSYEGREVVDCTGLVAIPGLIDSHIHVESSTLSPEAFAALAVPRGTTGIIADPHELVNVCGICGAEYLSEAFSRLTAEGISPLDVYMQLPSCVPATPFETSGAMLDGRETEEELSRPLFHGLAEMMNFPALLNGDEETLRKLQAARRADKVIDGHAPALTGDFLNAYAGTGILTDHEACSVSECLQKVGAGMYCQLRNGSSARNIMENYAAVTPYNYRRFLLCSDDKNAFDLKEKGHLDDGLRTLVRLGIPANQAVCTATLNVAECYRLKGKGALAAGYDADIVLVNNLTDFQVKATYKGGKLVAKEGKALFDGEKRYTPYGVKNTVILEKITADDLKIPCKSNRARALCVTPYGLTTDEKIVEACERDGDICLTDGLCKLAVVERHGKNGNLGLGLVAGYGLKGGAIATTVAHDSHNLVVLGDNNADMARAVNLLKEAGGGLALVSGDREEVVPFDIAGLMSSLPADEVIARTGRISAHAYEMGVKECYEPFMTAAFLSLVVIPTLKLTDRGLFDLKKGQFVELFV